MSRRIRWVVAGLAGVVIAAGTIASAGNRAARPGADQRVDAATPAKIGGPFTLVDQTGRTVTDRTFRGRFMLIFFGYTYCPDVCPTDLQIISVAMDRLGEAGKRVQPIFISVDPERDTARVMADYVGNFDARLIGLTGTLAQVKAAARAYRVRFFKAYPVSARQNPDKTARTGAAGDDAGYFVSHSAITYLMGPQGNFLRIFGHDTDPGEMAEGILEYLSHTP